jgi:MSHA pilin protein MshD
MSIPERHVPDHGVPDRRVPDNRVNRRRQRGLSLIELIMFVVIVSVAVAGVLSVFNVATQKSADPAARKQLLAIAEAMLQEVQLMPFTCRDPDDPDAGNAAVALSGNDCAPGGTAEAIGPEAGESRYNAANPFDNVNDYSGFDTAAAAPVGIADLSGTVIGGERFAALSHC